MTTGYCFLVVSVEVQSTNVVLST